jgi:flagellar motor switch protein FliM
MADFKPLSDEELRQAAESKVKRRAEFAQLVQDAGMDPSQIDVTKIMDDEEQARVIAHLAAGRKAKELANELGRNALRERLKRSVEIHQQTCDQQTMRFKKPD